MTHDFFKPKKVEAIPEAKLAPFLTPLDYFASTFIFILLIVIVSFWFNLTIFLSIMNLSSLGMFIFMFLFVIRTTGRNPRKLGTEFRFITKHIFYFLISILILTLISYLLLYPYNSKILSFNNSQLLLISIHLSIISIFLPFFFNYVLNRFGIDIPFKLFLNMHTHILKDTNLFTSTKQELEHHKKDEIYIDIIQQTKVPSSKIDKKNYLKIQNMYLRLIKFWYAQKHYSFKLRSYFSILISIGSLIYFFYVLNCVHQLQEDSKILGLQSMGIVAIALTILYFTMSHHINSFLHSEFYTSNILKELNKIYFDKHNHRQQLKLFLDKNFLIYIHDKHQDKHFCVNDSKDFQDFITNKTADEEGRNLIIMVYISFFMILFIETSTGDLLGNDINTSKSDSNTSNPIIKKETKTPCIPTP